MAKCLNPSTVLNPRYKKMLANEFANYTRDVVGYDNCIFLSNVGFVPPDYYIDIPCGTCYHCLKNKRNYWISRLLVEMDQHKESTFITLTLDDFYLEKFKGDYKTPIKLYIDRLRKALGFRPRYWIVSELGDEEKYSGRLHYHGIFFGTSKETLSFALQRMKWTYGISYFGYVHTKTAYYLTKYLVKQQPKEDYKPFILCSKGIGSAYVSQSNLNKILNGFDMKLFIEVHGRRFPIAPYFKNKFFNDDIKLCNMLNTANAVIDLKVFNGITYYDDIAYRRAVDSYYRRTLVDGLSVEREKRIYNNYSFVPNTSFSPQNYFVELQLKLFENE